MVSRVRRHADAADLDDDNDGIPDAVEGDGSVDTDGDGERTASTSTATNDGTFLAGGMGIPGGLQARLLRWPGGRSAWHGITAPAP